MFSVAQGSEVRNIVYALLLELIFLCFSSVFIGLGLSELKKGKAKFENGILALFGIAIGLISLYVTFIFIQG